MKIFTFAVIAIIVAMFVFVALVPPDSSYGRFPALGFAAAASGLLLLVYFSIYGWLRQDKYVLGALLFLGLDAGGTLAILLSHLSRSNSFGLSWGFVIIFGRYGLTLLLFGLIRIIYIAMATRSNPFTLPAKIKRQQNRVAPTDP